MTEAVLTDETPRVSESYPGMLKATMMVIRKDVTLEWRGRARLNATLFFALLSLLLFSFAVGTEPLLLRRTAAGFLWLAILLSSVMSLGESLRIEKENEALEGLRLLAVSARAIFLAKTLVNTVFLIALGAFLVPVAVAVYDLELLLGFPKMVAVIALGCAAISAPGTMYAAIAVQARARDVLLPLLLFPVLVPSLIAAVKATALILTGDAMNELGGWMTLLGATAAIYWIVCTLLFGRIIED